ncbi:pyridoxal-phosphate dependent enzyme [Achromobacter xylosoxidans]
MSFRSGKLPNFHKHRVARETRARAMACHADMKRMSFTPRAALAMLSGPPVFHCAAARHLHESPLLPDFEDVVAAADRLAGHALRTPVLRSAAMDAWVGAELHFKCENLQRTGAFKFRGAFNALARLDAGQRRRGAVAFSGGNHAQGIALAGRMLDIPVTVVMPRDAAASKMEATRAAAPASSCTTAAPTIGKPLRGGCRKATG